ncbi:hypothetical protein ANCDUO_11315 [Ancylostoma duodenale]|uniref:Uncharacterized protein n=1 Tax=Ancylostoma duodenale TaxID=51022 RepID=A0A0C2CP37_9BILA|nr:hypothetical protein ANCDUO_11315 [Ancylostoma duodenale]
MTRVSVLSTPATTEQLRQWILANRKSIYGENSITDGDLAGTILRVASNISSTPAWQFVCNDAKEFLP